MLAALRVDALAKRFGATLAVREVSFTVERGQIFGLLGPNGSGKTTTLACALGLLFPDSGRVEILGVPAAEIHRTAGRVGVVFDEATLIPGLGARANLQYARRLLGHSGGRSVDESLEAVGLSDLASRRAGHLSLGQRRRLAIARALLGAPELIVLDEPLSGLDTLGVRDVLLLIRRLADEGLTLIVSSHQLHEMERIVSHVAVLLRGRLLRCAPLAELLGEGGRLRIEVTPVERARSVLSALPGLLSLEASGPSQLHVDPGDVPPALLARRLVEGGCELSALVPERRTLAAAFDSLLEGALDGAPETSSS